MAFQMSISIVGSDGPWDYDHFSSQLDNLCPTEGGFRSLPVDNPPSLWRCNREGGRQ